MPLANRESALLLTVHKDFGEMVFHQRLYTHGGVLIHLAGLSPDPRAEMVASVINQHTTELSCAFTVIVPGIVRIRRFGG